MCEEERKTVFPQTKNLSQCISITEDELKSLKKCLTWLCIGHSNPLLLCLSCSLFFLMTIVVPILSRFVLTCPNCDVKHHRPYNGVVQLSLSCIAALSFFCLSRFVRKYGLRRFLFLDKVDDQSENVREGYTAQLHRSLKLLALFVLPSFGAEAAYKIWWYSSEPRDIPFLGNMYLSDVIACSLEICSWLYRTSIFFVVCVLFRLICHLQILRIHDFARVFQEKSDVASVFMNYLRIRKHLEIISHRYRVFILFALFIFTGSQLATLLSTTRPVAEINNLEACELALCSMTFVAGIFMLLRSATKITHKAHSLASLAAKWHVCATIDSFEDIDGETEKDGIAAVGQVSTANMNGESDNEVAADGDDDELDNTKIMMPAYARSIAFHKRQALGIWLSMKTDSTVCISLLQRSLGILAWFVLPCFAAEACYKIWWYGSGASQIPFLGNVYLSDAIACILEIFSWLYRTSIFFLVCVLFRLICSLQILRFQDFAQVFQEESDVGCVLKEHLRIRRQLRIISHRYRAFILYALITVTASQFASLLITTRANANVNIYRAGELALCSMTFVAGLAILLRSTTKITHKAQSVTCLAAKWHICATLDSYDNTNGETPPTQVASDGGRVFPANINVESDDDTADGCEDDDIDNTRIIFPAYTHTICFQKRQALVTYFENNRAGIAVYGFMLDRTLLHAIFGVELSLVLWLLGKTVGI